MPLHFSFTKFFRTIVLMANVNWESTSSSSWLPGGIGEGMEIRRRKNAPRFCNSWPPSGVSKSDGSVQIPPIGTQLPAKDVAQETTTTDDVKISITPDIPHAPKSTSPCRLPTGENPIIRMMKEQGVGKHAVNLVWAVVVQILTGINASDESGTHPLKVGMAAIILSLLLGFAVTWNGLLLRGWVTREGDALALEQLGLSIIYLSLLSFVALHVYHSIPELLLLLFICFLVVLPFLLANLSGPVKANVATD